MSSIELVSRTGDKRFLEEIDSNTLKIKGSASIQRRLFNQSEKEVFSINFKGGPYLEVGQNLSGFIIESIDAEGEGEESFFIVKGKRI